MNAPFTIAVDGPAASGKGTICRTLAEAFGLAHLDTGLLYRGVGLATLRGANPVAAARALTPDDLADEAALRTGEVAQEASKVAAIPEVRAALLDFQRAFARRAGGAVLDGRDIGTVICPQAEVKLFVTASPEVRAERRFLELSGKGHDVTREGVLADVRARDARDMSRAEAPLMAAVGAVTLDTSTMTIAEALEKAIAAVRPAYEAVRG
ncbi:(d)CMP kinase [Roseobacteraceae bacterium S113]